VQGQVIVGEYSAAKRMSILHPCAECSLQRLAGVSRIVIQRYFTPGTGYLTSFLLDTNLGQIKHKRFDI
jgi:hypothetical protein